jgi:hypothetical protein
MYGRTNDGGGCLVLMSEGRSTVPFCRIAPLFSMLRHAAQASHAKGLRQSFLQLCGIEL